MYEETEKPGLSYAGTSPAQNLLVLGLTAGLSYDDNVLGDNQQRTGDTYFQFGPSLGLRREGSRLSLALSYQPHFLVYRNASELNTINQGLTLDMGFRLNSRLAIGAQTSASYTTGFIQPSPSEEVLPGISSPSTLNQTVFTPTVRQLMLSSRIDASFQVRAHDSVDLFVSQSTLDFGQQVSNARSIQNTMERGTGLLYRHQMSRHTTVGIDYLLQDIRFGTDSRTLVQSAFLYYAQQFSPTVSLSVFCGPQFSRLDGTFSLLPDPSILQAQASRTQWNWAIGGVLTKRSDKTVFQLSAQHLVSNGGGLLSSAVSSYVETSVRRRLGGRWDATVSGGYANNSSLASELSQEGYRSLTLGVGLQHPLTEKLSLGGQYGFVHQSGTGNSPVFTNFDRDVWSVQLSYRFRAIALGR
jgi:hypothetical protein